jgi:hypothetical protein
MLSLTDWSRYSPALPVGHPFLNIDTGAFYWTSTTYQSTTGPRACTSKIMTKGTLSQLLKNHSQPTLWLVRGGIHGDAIRDADFDGDGDVDGRDLAILVATYGAQYTDDHFDFRADLIGDLIINQQDLEDFIPHLGRMDCPCH